MSKIQKPKVTSVELVCGEMKISLNQNKWMGNLVIMVKPGAITNTQAYSATLEQAIQNKYLVDRNGQQLQLGKVRVWALEKIQKIANRLNECGWELEVLEEITS